MVGPEAQPASRLRAAALARGKFFMKMSCLRQLRNGE
jgi:hypothetical protein